MNTIPLSKIDLQNLTYDAFIKQYDLQIVDKKKKLRKCFTECRNIILTLYDENIIMEIWCPDSHNITQFKLYIASLGVSYVMKYSKRALAGINQSTNLKKNIRYPQTFQYELEYDIITSQKFTKSDLSKIGWLLFSPHTADTYGGIQQIFDIAKRLILEMPDSKMYLQCHNKMDNDETIYIKGFVITSPLLGDSFIITYAYWHQYQYTYRIHSSKQQLTREVGRQIGGVYDFVQNQFLWHKIMLSQNEGTLSIL